MKKLIPILLLIILSLALSSCIRIYLPDNQNTDSQITQADTDIITNDTGADTVKITPNISRVSVNKDIYSSYNLGEYYGSGFKFEEPTSLGKAEYEIIQTYTELKKDTEYGVLVDEALFDNFVILVIKYFSFIA